MKLRTLGLKDSRKWKNSYLQQTIKSNFTFTFTFSHLADTFIQSDLQLGVAYIKRLILKRQTYRGSANNTKSQALFK